MLHIGCHLSSSKGFLAMGRQALELGADTFQFFTRNPRGSKAKELDPADAAALVVLMKEHCFAPIIAHAPYTLNLCGAEEKNRLSHGTPWRTICTVWSTYRDSSIISTPAAMWDRGAKLGSPISRKGLTPS